MQLIFTPIVSVVHVSEDEAPKLSNKTHCTCNHFAKLQDSSVQWPQGSPTFQIPVHLAVSAIGDTAYSQSINSEIWHKCSGYFLFTDVSDVLLTTICSLGNEAAHSFTVLALLLEFPPTASLSAMWLWHIRPWCVSRAIARMKH